MEVGPAVAAVTPDVLVWREVDAGRVGVPSATVVRLGELMTDADAEPDTIEKVARGDATVEARGEPSVELPGRKANKVGKVF